MRVLYHYTGTIHLNEILRTGYLKITDSMLREHDPHYKPVVWLTSEKNPDPFKLGLNGSMVDKTEVRIHVEKKPNLPIKSWDVFSAQNKIDPAWKKNMEAGRKPGTWFISTKEIPIENITLIENRYTGEIYYKSK